MPGRQVVVHIPVVLDVTEGDDQDVEDSIAPFANMMAEALLFCVKDGRFPGFQQRIVDKYSRIKRPDMKSNWSLVTPDVFLGLAMGLAKGSWIASGDPDGWQRVLEESDDGN